MNSCVNHLKKEFQEYKHNACMYNPSVMPIINELEYVAIQRATGKMSGSKARSKIKSCCMKVGINPIGIDQQALKPNFNFSNKPMKNHKPLNFKAVNLFANKKANNNPRERRRALGVNVPSVFPSSSLSHKKKQQFPAFNLQPTKRVGKVKRFELKPIKFGKWF